MAAAAGCGGEGRLSGLQPLPAESETSTPEALAAVSRHSLPSPALSAELQTKREDSARGSSSSWTADAKSANSLSSPKAHGYDEVTVNFGKPVIMVRRHPSTISGSSAVAVGLGGAPRPEKRPREKITAPESEADVFSSISFSSPIHDIGDGRISGGCPPAEDGSGASGDDNETSSSFSFRQLDELIVRQSKPSSRAVPVPAPRRLKMVDTGDQSLEPTQRIYENVERFHDSDRCSSAGGLEFRLGPYGVVKDTLEEPGQGRNIGDQKSDHGGEPPEDIYAEIEDDDGDEDEDKILNELGFSGNERGRTVPPRGAYAGSGGAPAFRGPGTSSADTIHMRKLLSQWYDEASQEVERDMSLDLSVFDNRSSSGSANSSSAVSGPRSSRGSDGPILAPTLLRNFDPLHQQEGLLGRCQQPVLGEESEDSCSDPDDDDDDVDVASPPDGGKTAIPDRVDERLIDSAVQLRPTRARECVASKQENVYSGSPGDESARSSSTATRAGTTLSTFSFDAPPPQFPPPPLPPLPRPLEPPPLPARKTEAYESVWLSSEGRSPIQAVILARNDDGALAQTLAIATKPDDQVNSAIGAGGGPGQLSSSSTCSSVSSSRLGGKFGGAHRSSGSAFSTSSTVSSTHSSHSDLKRPQLSSSSTSAEASVTEETCPKDQSPEGTGSGLSPTTTSFSTATVTRFAALVKRKFSERVAPSLPDRDSGNHLAYVEGSRRSTVPEESGVSTRPRHEKPSLRRKSSVLGENHSGVLQFSSGSGFSTKWCVLSGGEFCCYDDKLSLAIPKERIPLQSVLSITKRRLGNVNARSPPAPGEVEAEVAAAQDPDIFCFDIAFMTSEKRAILKPKHTVRTFSAACRGDRDLWVARIARSMSRRLAADIDIDQEAVDSAKRLCWANLKTGFAAEWEPSWILLRNTSIGYYTSAASGPGFPAADRTGLSGREDLQFCKVCKVTLVKDSKNLNDASANSYSRRHSTNLLPIVSQRPNRPVLVIDHVEGSLYIMPVTEKECLTLKAWVEQAAFNPGPRTHLEDHQLTREDIPVIVDKCVKFVYSQGCLSEGIYRISGVNNRIVALLGEFRGNAWSVHISREQYSEHDVANALKRFFRTLSDPLLTQRLRPSWLEVTQIPDKAIKISRYLELLNKLPKINYNTLRRLILHLRAISNEHEHNLMTAMNLSALFGPTLLTTDGQSATEVASLSTFATTSTEADVCHDMLSNFRVLFKVDDEEMKREDEILRALKKLQLRDNGRCLHKPSGDVMVWVYVDTNAFEKGLSVPVHPKARAEEIVARILGDPRFDGKECNREEYALHEVILKGNLERPLHPTECVLDATLKWGDWCEQDRRDNYLLLKPLNPFYAEALPLAVPPHSVFGEARFGGNSRRKAISDFRKHHFSVSNAKLVCSRSNGGQTATTAPPASSGSSPTTSPVEVGSWAVEKIWWYFGCEVGRSYSRLNLTFIERDRPMVRTKERPHFGHTISFESHEFFIKWVAALIVAEHPNDAGLKPRLLMLD